MKEIIKDENLVLNYVPGNGAWTYHIVIPGTKEIVGKWGDIKVSGTIDGHPFENMNLAPMTDQDKRMSVNGKIRKAIGKTGGDEVTVTMWKTSDNPITDKRVILDCFSDGGALQNFDALDHEAQNAILEDILSQIHEMNQEKMIVAYIKKLS